VYISVCIVIVIVIIVCIYVGNLLNIFMWV